MDRRNSPASNKLAEKYFHIVVEVKMKVTTPCRAIDGLPTTDNAEHFDELYNFIHESYALDCISNDSIIIFTRNTNRDVPDAECN